MRRNRLPWPRQAKSTIDGCYSCPVGLCDDYSREMRTTRKIVGDMITCRRMGCRVFRFGTAWRDMEPQPGVYDWAFWDSVMFTARDRGILPISYVGYTPQWAGARYNAPPANLTDFGDFIYRIARRYRGRYAHGNCGTSRITQTSGRAMQINMLSW